jgi:hypothetical protein
MGHQLDRRNHVRLPLRTPVFIQCGVQDAIEATAQNISVGGFYCRSRTEFVPGQDIDCVIVVGANGVSHDGAVRLLCRAHVVRVEAEDLDGQHGFACQIERYEVLDRTRNPGVNVVMSMSLLA